jgi:DNA polymerase-1
MYDEPFPIYKTEMLHELDEIAKEKSELEEILLSKYDLTADELSKLKNKDSKLEVINQYNRLSRYLNQFSKEKLLGENAERNALNSEIDSIGTASFRCCTRRMNLYGLPKRLRRYLKPRVGEELLTLDIHASQLLLLAWLADEQELIETYESGQDIYRIIAASLWNKAADMICENERSAGKKCVLMLMYGAGDSCLSDTLEKYGVNVSYDVVQNMRQNLYSAFPKIENYIEELQETDTFTLPSGRVFKEIKPYRRLSLQLQNIESEILKYSMILIAERIEQIPSTQLYMSLHDSLTVETSPSSRNKVKTIVTQSLLESFRLYFPEAKKIILKEE